MKKMKRLAQRGFAVLLALVLCAGTIAPALAKDYNAEDGTVHVDGVESWQGDGGDRYDHQANNDYTVNINGGGGSVDHTVVDVTENTSADIKVNIDNVDANVEEGPAANIQGGSVDIKDSNLSTGDEDSAAVEIGGNANVTVSGNTTVNGSGAGIEMTDDSSLTVNKDAELEVNGSQTEVTEGGVVAGGNTGIDMKDNSSLTVEEDGTLTANGSSVNVNVTDGKNVTVTVNGGNTGIQAGDHSEITIKGDAEVNGSVVTSEESNQANVAVGQEGNTGLELSGSAQVTVDGGELAAVDTQTGLNGTYTTKGWGSVSSSTWIYKSRFPTLQYRITLPDGTEKSFQAMYEAGEIFSKSGSNYSVLPKTWNSNKLSSLYIKTGVDGSGKPIYTPLDGRVSQLVDVKVTLSHNTQGEGTGIALNDSASLEAANEASLEAYGEKNAIELTGDTTLKIGESGLLHILGGPVSIGGNSSLTSAGVIYADDIGSFTKGGVSGHDAIDFQGTGLHFLTCIPGNIYKGESDTIYIYWDIGEDFDGKELTVHFADLMEQAKNICGKYVRLTAGENAHYKFIITNNSSHAFAYDADSLNVGRYSFEELVEKGSQYWPMRTDNFALRALYYPKHDPTTDAGARNLKGWGFGSDRVSALTFDQILEAEQYLKETGYDGQTFDSLDDYYLYFVNKMNGTQHQSLKEVPLPELSWIFSMEGNYSTTTGWYSDEGYQALLEQLKETGGAYEAMIVSANPFGGYNVALKDTGDIRELALNYFYQQCLQFGYGDGGGDRLGIDDYKNESTMSEAEKLMAEILSSLAAKDDPDGKNSVTIDAYYGLDGQKAGNFTEFTWKAFWAGATLVRTDSDPENPEKPTPDPEKPTPDPEKPTPDPEKPTPDPEKPTPDPEKPTPDPEKPTPDPEKPIPDPEKPTPDPGPVDPIPDPGPDDPTPPVEVDDPDMPLAPEPEIELDDPDAPLAPEPEIELDDPDIPLAPEPEIELDDPDVPLAPEPEIELDDPDVPLADVPQTGDNSHIWSIFAAVSGMGLIWLFLEDKKRTCADK